MSLNNSASNSPAPADRPYSKSTFSATSYAVARPSYPVTLYQKVLAYHRGPKNLCIDLGCGHGVVSYALSTHFTHIIGTDPSPGMIAKARASAPQSQYPNIEYRVAGAERLPFVSDSSVDLVVAGQSAHWFDYRQVWPELKRILRQGGTMAFWGYKDPVFVGWPRASAILDRYSYGNDPDTALGSYWEPGRFIVRNLLRDVRPPESVFMDIQRVEHEPDATKTTSRDGSGDPAIAVAKRMSVAQSMDYVRTFSSFHNWREAHPTAASRKEGGEGDVVDVMFDEIKEVEGWTDEALELEVEWGTALILARNM